MNIITHPPENASRIKAPWNRRWKRGLHPTGRTPFPYRLIYHDTHFPVTDLTMSGRMSDGFDSRLLYPMQQPVSISDAAAAGFCV